MAKFKTYLKTVLPCEGKFMVIINLSEHDKKTLRRLSTRSPDIYYFKSFFLAYFFIINQIADKQEGELLFVKGDEPISFYIGNKKYSFNLKLTKRFKSFDHETIINRFSYSLLVKDNETSVWD
jgi:hypothetical protein